MIRIGCARTRGYCGAVSEPVRNEPTPSSWTFPIECPECGDRTGFPDSAGTTIDHAVIRLALDCGSCHHRWYVSMPTKHVPAKVRPWRGLERRAAPRR